MLTSEKVTEELMYHWLEAKRHFITNAEFDVAFKNVDLEKFFDENAIIAGGCIASLFHEAPINDIDVFFRGGFKQYHKYPIKAGLYHFVAADCGVTPEDIVGAFDFEHCTYWFDGQLHEPAFRTWIDFSDKNLIYRKGVRRPGAALLRAGKMIERGWRLSKEDAELIIEEIRSSDKTNEELVAFDDYVPQEEAF